MNIRKDLGFALSAVLLFWALLAALSWCHATPKKETICAISLCTTVESKMLFPFGYETRETFSIVPGMEFMTNVFSDMLHTKVVEVHRFFYDTVIRSPAENNPR